jgi:hypothetical protein
MFMRAKAGILIIIGMMLLVGLVGAVGVPDTIVVTTDKQWIVANNLDQSTITVTVTNTTTTPTDFSGVVPGVTVNLAVDDTSGTISPATVTTNSSGKATSIFKAKTKSGAAQITATINTPAISGSTIQNIDHDSPYNVMFTHPLSGNVATEVPFKLSVTDRWGNRVDNLNPAEIHTVSLHVHGPGSDDCRFVENNLHDIARALDSNGNLTLNVRLTSIRGPNNILLDSFGSISDKIESIEAVAAGIPSSMTGSISNGGVLTANGQDKFTINYYLYDTYGNPLQNRSLWINTNLTDELTPKLYTTNSLGQIQMTYGPKISVLTVNITAIAADNSSVRNNLIASFVSSNVPSSLLLVVSPQTMASRDCDPSTTREAKVVAILTDDFGNPVTISQDVNFTISGISTAINNAAPGPSFESGSEILTKTVQTDGNGNAMLMFYPGSFIVDGNDSSGYCTVFATSGGISAVPVLVEWKNFAYLSVAVNATPRRVIVNETIDVTIRVTGDGYKMVSNPITVMLDMDATSNLAASSDGTNGKTRWINAQEASTTFVKNMSDQDKIGLVTHGEWTNYVYWQLIQNVSYNKPIVLAAIPNITPSGGLGGNATTLKDSIKAASDRIVSNPFYQPGEIDAIVTIGANSYAKNSGDLAEMVKATWTDHKIRVFSILYVSTTNMCDKKMDGSYKDDDAQNLWLLTNQTNGKFYCALSRPLVDTAFSDIYKTLSEIAGVNTSMNLDFSNVTVDSDPSWSGSDVFDYVVVDDGMTSPGSRTTILWPNNTRTFENQTEDWNDDSRLNFTVGTIKVKQSWETTFRLKVKKEGTIDLFGPGSTISYNDIPGNLRLPLTLIESVNNTIPLGLVGGMLEVSNLAHGDITNYVPLTWNLQYKGSATATETMWYSFNNGTWVQFGTVAGIPPTIAPDYLPYTHHAYMDITKLPPGYYQIKVKAFAPDSPDNEKIIDVGYVGNSGVYIKLE